MRLLDTETLRLEFFLGSSVPPYAILSHTWGDGEILFEDICDLNKPLPTHKTGFAKVKGSCEQAHRDGYRYIWIDTCCIDKSSSAELSEAINSMFRWYHGSARCYAYLADFHAPGGVGVTTFDKSRWFTRGWTLQELIAPCDVRFFDHSWTCIGTRQKTGNNDYNEYCLIEEISQRTDIPRKVLGWCTWSPGAFILRGDEICAVLLESALRSCSIAQKMSWAARRSTTREEDVAYSLLGLFGVNMPLLYGEGRRAFFRLQQEIMRVSDDQSILAYTQKSNWGLFPDSPERFVGSEVGHTGRYGGPEWPGGPQPPYELSPSPKYLDIGLCLCPLRHDYSRKEHVNVYLGILDCVYTSDKLSHPAMILRPADQNARKFYRINSYVLTRVSPLDINDGPFYVDQCEQHNAPSSSLGLETCPPTSPCPYLVPIFVSSRHLLGHKADRMQTPALRGNLAEAFYSVVRLYFDADPERPGRVSRLPMERSTPLYLGIKISFGRRVPGVSDMRAASYPADLRFGDSSIYLPVDPDLLSTPCPTLLIPSIEGMDFSVNVIGTVVLGLPSFGTVVLVCGEVGGGSPPWWAILHLSELSDIIYEDADRDDLAAIARLVYESPAYLISVLRKDDQIILESPALHEWKLRGSVRRSEFFGRPLVEIDLETFQHSDDTNMSDSHP